LDYDFNEDLDLGNVCLGDLNKEFKALYPQIMKSLNDGNKASIAITVEFAKVPNTTTMTNVNYSITPKYPARKKSGVCQMNDSFKLRTEKPPAPVENLKLFQAKAE